MRFTKYYRNLIKVNGLPHLNVEQHCRLMNIISLEGGINQLELLRCKQTVTSRKYELDIKLQHLKGKLKTLTLDHYPKEVMNNMLWLSKH